MQKLDVLLSGLGLVLMIGFVLFRRRKRPPSFGNQCISSVGSVYLRKKPVFPSIDRRMTEARPNQD